MCVGGAGGGVGVLGVLREVPIASEIASRRCGCLSAHRLSAVGDPIGTYNHVLLPLPALTTTKRIQHVCQMWLTVSQKSKEPKATPQQRK